MWNLARRCSLVISHTGNAPFQRQRQRHTGNPLTTFRGRDLSGLILRLRQMTREIITFRYFLRQPISVSVFAYHRLVLSFDLFKHFWEASSAFAELI